MTMKSVVDIETGGRWQELNRLFAEAVGLDEVACKRFLKEVADTKLRSELKAMLSAIERADSDGFLGGGALDAGTRIIAEWRAASLEEGDTLGNYTIVREIAHGGMGAIYLAKHRDLDQQVAIKIVKRGMDTDAILDRFMRERDILASLDHPNISKLFDGGVTDDGLPYFVMEYVDGRPITTYCDNDRLDLTERLQLFQKVCAAIAYAHQNLVVHRDIKPTNILITDEGEPKLLDFGISKVLKPDGLQTETAPELRLLTPEYASPEQFKGDSITTASDIYSLGVVLYELLSGHRPFELKGRRSIDILKIVSEQLPTAPSTVQGNAETDSDNGPATTGDAERWRRKLKGDLDNIVLMALRKEPDRRYATVEQFSEDVRRHLENLPVIARIGTFRYNAAKFVKRNTIAVTFAAVALVSLLTGLSTAIWQAVEARRERQIAQDRFDDVRSLANSLIDGWDKELPESAISDQVRARLANISSQYLEDLAADAGDDPELLRELADAYIKIGHTYSYLGIDIDKARTSLRKAEDISRNLLARRPSDAEAKLLVLRVLEEGDSMVVDSSVADGVKRSREITTLIEDIYPDPSADQAALSKLGVAYGIEGRILGLVGRVEESKAFYAKAVDMYRRRVELLETQESSSDNTLRLASAYNSLAADRAMHLSEVEPALENLRRSTTLAEQVLRRSPNNTDRRALGVALSSHAALGDILKLAGDVDGAIGPLTACHTLAAASGQASGVDAFVVRQAQDCLLGRAEAYWETGRGADAMKDITAAVDDRERFDRYNRDKAAKHYRLSRARFFVSTGQLLLRMGRQSEAKSALDQADQSLKAVPERERNEGFRRDLARYLLTAADLHAGVKPCGLARSYEFPSVADGFPYCPATGETHPVNAEQARKLYSQAIDLISQLQAAGNAFVTELEFKQIAEDRIRDLEAK
ncbi:MAG: serine/threonine protein kinase [Pyrinomonadaceae bacterium]|nr:serine/threonine protein kinase [Pyrinomonadaceae bacterium]